MDNDSTKCPVCGKVGIPNYHDADVVCPQCGSDLSIYRVIDQIPAGHKKNVWKPISVAAIIAVAVLVFFLVKPKQEEVVDVRTSPEYAQLQDSIGVLNEKIATLAVQPATVVSEGFPYVVRKGDSYWTISRKVYGTGTRYQEVAEANGLTVKDALHVGDTLIIK